MKLRLRFHPVPYNFVRVLTTTYVSQATELRCILVDEQACTFLAEDGELYEYELVQIPMLHGWTAILNVQ